jgi:prophage regulatory protein
MVSQLENALHILRRKQVQARTGLTRSTIYQKIAEGGFPKPVKLSSRAGWLQARVNASRSGVSGVTGGQSNE